jgi:hypothetical protein
VIGARLRQAWNQIRKSAANPTLHITGETGAGKEIGARTYHLAGPRPSGPFVGVNCAAIPEGVAERLLFGARKGAFSGADKDAEGYVQTDRRRHPVPRRDRRSQPGGAGQAPARARVARGAGARRRPADADRHTPVLGDATTTSA